MWNLPKSFIIYMFPFRYGCFEMAYIWAEIIYDDVWSLDGLVTQNFAMKMKKKANTLADVGINITLLHPKKKYISIQLALLYLFLRLFLISNAISIFFFCSIWHSSPFPQFVRFPISKPELVYSHKIPVNLVVVCMCFFSLSIILVVVCIIRLKRCQTR